jgi:hypothetical protein
MDEKLPTLMKKKIEKWMDERFYMKIMDEKFPNWMKKI